MSESGLVLRAPLVAGYDTLARSFGDVLYVGILPGKYLPCPACSDLDPLIEDRQGSKPALICRDSTCGICLPIEDLRWDLRWAGFLTQELLGLGVEWLHLRGPWNPDSLIRRADLAQRYQLFLNERKSHVGY
jgi:hypothetical protein